MERLEIVKNSQTPWEHRFESLGDMVDYLQSLSDLPTDKKCQGSIVSTERTKFTGAKSLQEAIDLARGGWPEGRAMMVDGVRDAFRGRTTAGIGLGMTYDVAGAYPCAPMAAAGEMACMVDFQPELRSARPIIKLLVPFVYSGGCPHNIIINRGVALLTLIDAIEAAGQRCEIDIIWASGSPVEFVLRVCVKSPEEPLDLDRLAFVLAHPSMLRRLGFAFIDKSEGGPRGPGYGFPGRLTSAQVPPGWNYLPGIDYNNLGVFDTIPAALAYLEPLMVAEPEGLRIGLASS